MIRVTFKKLVRDPEVSQRNIFSVKYGNFKINKPIILNSRNIVKK